MFTTILVLIIIMLLSSLIAVDFERSDKINPAFALGLLGVIIMLLDYLYS